MSLMFGKERHSWLKYFKTTCMKRLHTAFQNHTAAYLLISPVSGFTPYKSSDLGSTIGGFWNAGGDICCACDWWLQLTTER